jgi:hypothetical protein
MGRAQHVPRLTLFERIRDKTKLPRKELEKVFGDE